MDYVMPRSEDLPPVKMVHHDSPNPDTYMGLKGAGEAGVGGSAAAMANAINNALMPFGVAVNTLPLSPSNVWNALQQAQKIPQKEAAE
jgi:carbon-monoxide dehydrogenase large subunit